MTLLHVPDMSCGHCKASVEQALAPLSQRVAVDLANRQVMVDSTVDDAALLKAMDAIGFPARVIPA